MSKDKPDDRPPRFRFQGNKIVGVVSESSPSATDPISGSDTKDSGQSARAYTVDYAAPTRKDPKDDPMSDITRPEMDAKLEAIEARLDARVMSIQKDISHLVESVGEMKQKMDGLKNTVVVTGISSVIAIVLGVAAFNAALTSNMLGSFDSGKAVGESLERTSQQMSKTQESLQKLTDALSRQADSNSSAPPGK